MLFEEFVSTYCTTIIYTLLSAAMTALGAWVGRIYKEKVNDETKRKVVQTCCKAVEQLYRCAVYCRAYTCPPTHSGIL